MRHRRVIWPQGIVCCEKGRDLKEGRPRKRKEFVTNYSTRWEIIFEGMTEPLSKSISGARDHSNAPRHNSVAGGRPSLEWHRESSGRD